MSKVVLRHAFLSGQVCRFISSKRHLIGQSQELQFVLGLDHAAAGRYWACAESLQSRAGLGSTFSKDVAHGLFRTQAAGTDSTIFHALRQALAASLIICPQTD